MTKELWLPTSTTHATVSADGNVQVWDTIEFERRKTKTPVAIKANTIAVDDRTQKAF